LESDCNYIERMIPIKHSRVGENSVDAVAVACHDRVVRGDAEESSRSFNEMRERGSFLLNNVTLEMAVGINESSRELSKRMIRQSSMEQMNQTLTILGHRHG